MSSEEKPPLSTSTHAGAYRQSRNDTISSRWRTSRSLPRPQSTLGQTSRRWLSPALAPLLLAVPFATAFNPARSFQRRCQAWPHGEISCPAARNEKLSATVIGGWGINFRTRSALQASLASSASSEKPKNQIVVGSQSHGATTSKRQIRRLFQEAKNLERKGQWRKAASLLETILTEHDPRDSYSHLALAKLEARRHDWEATQAAFERGTAACPQSIHLWQAWAVHEESCGRFSQARSLYERALTLDPNNPYVCHAFGLLELRHCHNATAAAFLWERALSHNASSTAALVCSLGELYLSQKKHNKARELYKTHVSNVKTKREKVEVYLAHAWLEEKYSKDYIFAQTLLQRALLLDPTSSLAQVALARLEGRLVVHQRPKKSRSATKAVAQSRQQPQIIGGRSAQQQQQVTLQRLAHHAKRQVKTKDGRVFNAWAKGEVKAKRYRRARKILQQGLQRHERDHALWQAAGKVEELLHNASGARALYSQSLYIQPSAPALVSYALLELKHPETVRAGGDPKHARANFTMVRGLFEEALLLDPRHGPAYNSYGNALLRHGKDVDAARAIFEKGIGAHCKDAASVYHGYAKLELSLGNVSAARRLLLQGQDESNLQNIGTDSPHRARASFLSHTLGMLELSSGNAVEARRVFLDGLERYGNHSSSQLLLGAALAEGQLGNVDEAREWFEKSVSINERHAQAWQAWGVFEMQAGNLQTAETLVSCGLRANPRYGPLYLSLATLHGRRGQVAQARMTLATGLQKATTAVASEEDDNKKNTAALLRAWASLELRQGKSEAARVLITQALTHEKRSGAGWLLAAEIERRSGNIGLVNLILRRGIELVTTTRSTTGRYRSGGSSGSALFRALGQELLRQGKVNEAREIFERGIDLNPHHAPLYHSLAELEAQVFNLEGLSKLNKRAAEIFQQQQPRGNNRLSSGGERKAAQQPQHRIDGDRRVLGQVTALAQRIVEDEHDDDDNDDERADGGMNTDFVDPDEYLERLSTDILEQRQQQEGDDADDGLQLLATVSSGPAISRE